MDKKLINYQKIQKRVLTKNACGCIIETTKNERSTCYGSIDDGVYLDRKIKSLARIQTLGVLGISVKEHET